MKKTKIGILAIAFLFVGLAGCNNDEMVDEAPQEVLDLRY